MTNYQEANNGCQYNNCGAATFSKKVDGKKMWKVTCPKHEDKLNEIVITDTPEIKEEIEVKEVSLSDLEKQLAELQEKVRLAKEAEVERIRLEELKKPVVMTIGDISYDNITISFDRVHDKVVEILRNTRGRRYDSFSNTNSIPISSWITFINEITTIENIKIKPEKSVEQIKEYIEEVDVYVDDNSKEFILTIARRRKGWVIDTLSNKLPGCKLIQPTKENKHYRLNVPLSEGWRLGTVLEEFVKYRYIDTYNISEHSLTIINEQIESRQKLDGAAQLENVEFSFDLDLNGQTLKPFQKVGVRFACLALGLGDIAK